MSIPEPPPIPEDEGPIPPEEDIWQYMPWLREARQCIAEETEGMTPQERADYWNRSHAQHQARRAAEDEARRAGRSRAQEGEA